MTTDQTSKNSRKRSRQDSDQDISTSTPGTALQPRDESGPPSAGPHTVPSIHLHSGPNPNSVISSLNGKPDPTEFASISEWITQLSHDEVQQLLADAAARHKDVYLTLQASFLKLELTRRNDKLRIEKDMMNTFYPSRNLHNTSQFTSTRAPTTEQAIILARSTQEQEEKEPDFGSCPTQVQQILDQSWEHLDHPDRAEKVGEVTDHILELVNEILKKIGNHSTYQAKATALLRIFRIAEVLTESSTPLANHVRGEIMYCGFSDRVLGMVRRLNTVDAILFLRNQHYTEYLLEDIFEKRVLSSSSSTIVAHIKSIILDFKSEEWRTIVLKEPELHGSSI